MKYKFLLIALVALTMLQCSCEQKQRPERPTYEKITESELAYGEIETGTIPGDYIYRIIQVDSFGLLLKYHIPTGTATTVCQDPFCDHDVMTCPFSVSPKNITSIGNMLYYTVESEGRWHLRAYDGDSMELTNVRTSNGVLHRLFSYNYYLYFSETLPGQIEGAYKTTVYRFDTSSGALDIIDCGKESATIELIEVGRIVWKNYNDYYSTDLDGDDWCVYEQAGVREWGKYKLRWELGKNDIEKMYCKDLSTGEEILIAEKVADFYVYGDKMVYFQLAPTRVWTDENGTEVKDQYGGNVYVVNLDGTGERLLCHVEDFAFLCGSSDRNNEFVCGDWIGFISKSYYAESGNSPSLLLTDVLFVNVVTGEYRFIKYNPYE